MNTIRLTALQAGAYAILQRTEPPTRSFTLMPLGDFTRPYLTAGVAPGEDYSAGQLPFRPTGQNMLVVTNAESLDAAADDADELLRLHGDLDIVGAVLYSDGWLAEHRDGALPHRFGDVLANDPHTALRSQTPLGIWLTGREVVFAPVQVASDLEGAHERWLHVATTGQLPDEQDAAKIAALTGDGDSLNAMLGDIARAAYASLDEATSTEDALRALINGSERPQISTLRKAAAAALFTAVHVQDTPARAQLTAIGALLLWNIAQGRSAEHAITVALELDRSASFPRAIAALIRTIDRPDWVTY